MTFSEVVSAAIKYFSENGFDSQESLDFWLGELRRAAEEAATSRSRMERMLNESLRAVFDRFVRSQTVERARKGPERFTLAMIEPKLRGELDRRILASANLIKLNRAETIEAILRRFQGLVTSIPLGGSDAVKRGKEANNVKKAMQSLSFRERRVLTDQGHKLTASLDAIVAKEGGAIAARWFSHWRQLNYDYREDHKERDGQVYLIRDSWARDRGLVRSGDAGFTDEITQPGEEVYCRCRYTYLFHLRQLPADMLTKKGKEALEAVRGRRAAA
jgi:hypothetical protein